jgi:hypothetical protein
MGHRVPAWAARSGVLARACSELVSRVLYVRAA